MKDIFEKKLGTIIVLLICLLLASIPALKFTTIYNAVDIPFHIKRVDGLVKAMENFVIPYRLNSVENLGYGGASPIMYPYLFLIIPAIIYKICGDYNIAWNIMNILINIFTIVVMYYSSYKIFESKKVSLISTILITLSIYRVDLMFGAGAIGEYIAMACIPLVAEGYANVLKGKCKSWIDLLIGLTLIMQSHMITITYVSVLLLVLSLIFIKKTISNKDIFISLIKTLVFFVLINLWFIVPFLHYYFNEKLAFPESGFEYAQASVLNLSDQLLLPLRILKGYFLAFGKEHLHRHVSFMTILAFVILIFLIIKEFIGQKKNANKISDDNKIISFIFLLIFIVNVIISSGIFTRALLGHIGFLQKFFILQQFESREIGRGLSLLYMAFAYMIITCINGCKKAKKQIDVAYIVTLILIVCVSMIPISKLYLYVFNKQEKINNYSDFCNGDYMLRGTLVGNSSQALIVQVGYSASLPKDIFSGKLRVDNDGIEISEEKKGYLSYSFRYRNTDGEVHEVEIPYFRYLGFKAFNKKGKSINTRYGENNLIKVQLKDSEGKITVKFVEPIVWRISEIISLISIILLILFCNSYKFLKNHNKVI